jgi:hypothetical protein
MKLRVVMKCPDALDFAIEKAIEEYFQDYDKDSDEYEDFLYLKRKEVENVVNKYFRYGEILTVIVDTKNQTCVVDEV